MRLTVVEFPRHDKILRGVATTVREDLMDEIVL
jgi:hypothetical protein